ncbi:MAG: peptidase [Prochlorotrichaceae cyanobacterium]|jgi:hypothetical protein
MQRTFRKYHRWIAPILALPIFLTVITGMLATIVQEWDLEIGLKWQWLMQIHTGDFLHLGKIYPILNGLGLLALLITGLSMTRLFKPQTRKPSAD